jgi:hypothetical protein
MRGFWAALVRVSLQGNTKFVVSGDGGLMGEVRMQVLERVSWFG